MDIRPARPEEWRAVRALRLRALADAPDAFGSTLARESAEPEDVWRAFWLGRPGTIALVADDGGELVGMAFGWASRDGPAAAGLFGMWVDPAARRRGIGGALVQAVLDWGGSVGFRTVELGVTTSNADAVAFYAALGFVDTGQRDALRPGSSLEVQVMVAALDQRR